MINYKINPYRPGAGLMPGYIAGRDEYIQEVKQRLDEYKQWLNQEGY